jgi:hypothetical protein
LALLLLLVVGDGLRSRADTVADFGGVSVRPYEFYANPDQLTARDGAAGQLPSALRHPPDSRPARTPPFRSPRLRTQGTPIDALGFLAMGYRIQGHGGFQTAAKVEALRDPMLTEMLLEPWTAWTVPCTEIDCDRIEQLPDPAAWRTTDAARTLSYGTDTIDYEINLAERALLIENEINFPGWGTDSDLVRAVDHDGPFRAWVAESGSYQFRAQFRTTTLRNAVLLATAALVAWSVAAAMVFWHRSRPQAAADPPTGDSTGSVLEDRAPTAGEEGVNGSSDGSAAAPATFGS